jgi:hypothetical protein
VTAFVLPPPLRLPDEERRDVAAEHAVRAAAEHAVRVAAERAVPGLAYPWSVTTRKAGDDERRGWAIDDAVLKLRRWGDDRAFELPPPPIDAWMIGAAPDCDLRLDSDLGRVSRHHARLEREGLAWILRDNKSTNGIRQDGEQRLSVQLAPGIEIEIGDVALIAESQRLATLRALLARIIGWSDSSRRDVDRALRAVREMATLRAALMLSGEGDLTPIARKLHTLALGEHRPFVVCESNSMAALESVGTGTLCVLGDRLPEDFPQAIAQIAAQRSAARVIVCSETRAAGRHAAAHLGRTTAIELPPIASRTGDLDQLVKEFAADAVAILGASGTGFREHEMVWIRTTSLETLAEIEEVTFRIVAMRNYGVRGGAFRIGITHAGLSLWARRRNIPT